MKYDKKQDTSFANGMFAVIELIKNRPEQIVGVYYSNKLKINDKVQEVFNFCKKKNITLLERTKFIESVAGKENVFIIAEFKKYQDKIENGYHILLVSPSDMGNMGTILRTCLGFGIKNVGIVKPCVDYFDPKVVRASQGAIFNLNIQTFDNFDEYSKMFSQNHKYMFCLNGEKFLQEIGEKSKPYTLVFGNEGTGLSEEITEQGERVKIRQSEEIDSFNLAISVAMAIYEFNR